MTYVCPCPVCGTDIETPESVMLDETHEPDGTLLRVRVHHGSDVIHECELRPDSSMPSRSASVA
jgi:hypothetical protein